MLDLVTVEDRGCTTFAEGELARGEKNGAVSAPSLYRSSIKSQSKPCTR